MRCECRDDVHPPVGCLCRGMFVKQYRRKDQVLWLCEGCVHKGDHEVVNKELSHGCR